MRCHLCTTSLCLPSFFFFFNDTATTEIYTLSLHDALPIFARRARAAPPGAPPASPAPEEERDDAPDEHDPEEPEPGPPSSISQHCLTSLFSLLLWMVPRSQPVCVRPREVSQVRQSAQHSASDYERRRTLAGRPRCTRR